MVEGSVLAPGFLALLPLAVALGAIDAWRTRGRRRAGAMLRGLVLALVALGLARPIWTPTQPTTTTVHVVDASASVSPEAWSAALVEAVTARAMAQGDDTVHAVAFGAEAIALPTEGAVLPPGFDRQGSDLAGALGLATALLPPGGEARVVLHTDGTAPDAAAALAALEATGVSVESRPLERDLSAPRIASGRGPATPLSPGATLSVEADVFGGADGVSGAIPLTLNDELLAEQVVSIPPGGSVRVTWTATIPPDATPGLAEARVSVGDDGFTVPVLLRRPPSVWLVGAPRATAPLAALLRAEEMAVVEHRAASLPADPSAALADVDLVVLAGTPTEPGPDRPAALPAGFVLALPEYVRGGGGLLTLGGEFAYDQGGWHRSPLADLLPVTMDPKGEEEQGDLTLVIALDKSGSMAQSAGTGGSPAVSNIGARMGAGSTRDGSKIQVVSRAALAAVSLLRPDDLVGVLAVDTKPDWVVPVQEAARRVRIMDAVLGIGAGGGGIFVSATLQEARAALTSRDTRLRHLILFADTGDAVQQTDPETGQPAAELVREMAEQDEITVSVIGVGGPGDRDVGFLRSLATAGNGRFLQTTSVQGLQTLFIDETKRVLGQGLEEQVRIRPRRVGMHPALQGVDVRRAPALRGMNRVEQKARSRTLLVGPEDRPLLALGRVGQGQVGAWTSDAAGRWAAGWARWAPADRLWVQLARSLARSESGDQGLVLEVERGTATATSRGPDGLTLPRPGMRLVLVEGDDETVLPAALSAPGQWRAAVPLREAERGRVEARDATGRVLAAADTLGPASPERAAALLAPEALSWPSLSEGGRPERRDSVPLGAGLLVFAALLLPLEAWMRRRGA